jgi:hypothetical protein
LLTGFRDENCCCPSQQNLKILSVCRGALLIGEELIYTRGWHGLPLFGASSLFSGEPTFRIVNVQEDFQELSPEVAHINGFVLALMRAQESIFPKCAIVLPLRGDYLAHGTT